MGVNWCAVAAAVSSKQHAERRGSYSMSTAVHAMPTYVRTVVCIISLGLPVACGEAVGSLPRTPVD